MPSDNELAASDLFSQRFEVVEVIAVSRDHQKGPMVVPNR